jgi:hypothetical protein
MRLRRFRRQESVIDLWFYVLHRISIPYSACLEAPVVVIVRRRRRIEFLSRHKNA